MLKGAVIGLGRVGWEYDKDVLRQKPASHVGAMFNNKDIELVAVYDKDKKKLETFKKLYPSVKTYGDGFDMLKENKLDIITIATPDGTHRDLVFGCAELGEPKVILCEKPIASTIEEAKSMVRICKKNGVKLAINHTRRWMPEYQNVKIAIDYGNFGKPVLFVGYFYGGLRDFCHLADLYNWLTPGTPYTFHKLDYKNEVDYMIFEQDIFFTKGRINIKDNGREIRYYKADSSWHYEGIRELKQSYKVNSRQLPTPISLVYEDLVKCATSEKLPECTGEDGLKALELSLKILGDENG